MHRSGTLLGALTVLVGLTLPAMGHAQQRPSDKQLDRAVERAVKFLQQRQLKDGGWSDREADKKGAPGYDVAVTALVALALLESDVPHTDLAIVRAANLVRSSAPRLTMTYPISLAIIFLDRIAGSENKDKALIQTLAYRLCAGQEPTSGGWTYACQSTEPASYWADFLKKNRLQTDFGKLELQGAADNFNTQFAMLALWVARRHGVPTDYSLKLATARFRQTQAEDGGWSYLPGIPGSNGSATCAGMIGLVGEYTTANTGGRAALRTNHQFLAGEKFLASCMDHMDPKSEDFFSFLWSLDRVAVIYQLDKVAGKDWYAWGASHLVRIQGQDGSWKSKDAAVSNTAFALLFLPRAYVLGQVEKWQGKESAVTDTALALLFIRKINFFKDLDINPGPRVPPSYVIPEASKYRQDAPGAAAKLAQEILTAKPERQTEILEVLELTRDGSGSFTETLIGLIPKLEDTTQEGARSALAARFARQSAKAIRERLSEKNDEVRAAAARAAGWKVLIAREDRNDEDHQLVPDLILLVEDNNELVAKAAEQALKDITRQDLGRTAKPWQEYWERKKK